MLKTPPIAANFNPTVLIYHEKCMDGFAAAQIASHYSELKLRKVISEDLKNGLLSNREPHWKSAIRLIPYSHKDKIASGLNNHNIVFIDCSYERPDLIDLEKIANRILVLDHHVTTEEECGDLYYVHINKNVSGAKLAWDFFFPGRELPIQFMHIQDHDLFRFENFSTKEFCAALNQYEMTLENWNTYFPINMSPYQYGVHLTTGRSILKYKQTLATQLAKESHVIEFLGHKAVWCNAPFPLYADVAPLLKEENPDCDFTICIGIENIDTVYLSFRSSKFNVEKLAKSLGGGGHPLASGCRISFAKFIELFGFPV